MLSNARRDSPLCWILLSCFSSLLTKSLIAAYISKCLAEATSGDPLEAIVASITNPSGSLDKMRVD
jgi:hypothetical protein